MRYAFSLALLALPLLLPAAVRAQSERFQIGQRLRLFEKSWDHEKGAAGRRRALEIVQPITKLFFAAKLGDVARVLDEARHALRSAKEPPAGVRWADALDVILSRCLFPTDADGLTVQLRPSYKVKAEPPQGASVRLMLLRADGKEVLARADAAVAALPQEVKLPLQGRRIPEGDHLLLVQFLVGGQPAGRGREQTVSFAANLEGRLGALRKAVEALPAKPATTDAESARGLVEVLGALAAGTPQETNYPAARLLPEAEAVVRAARAGKPYYGAAKAGQFWLRLPTSKRSVPVRLLAPDAVQRGEPLPLVIALHGAGASENLFFEGYGDGAVVRQCAARGWLLVSPRADFFNTPPVPELIDALARLYPVDRKRVFVVGHSMGAMQAVAAAGAAPERFAAVAPLGGGGSFKKSEAIKKVRFFVGVGSRDFLLSMARSLKEGLGKAGVETVLFREYPDIEHLMIVQVALPDVFAFFDAAAKK